MAASNFKVRQVITASTVGKRAANQIWTSKLSSSSPAFTLLFRRSEHTSVYDKNIDEQVRPTIVPDNVTEGADKSGDKYKYWAPHPETGVFGPPSSQHVTYTKSASTQGSVLEEHAWFRPTGLEDLEKPHHHY